MPSDEVINIVRQFNPALFRHRWMNDSSNVQDIKNIKIKKMSMGVLVTETTSSAPNDSGFVINYMPLQANRSESCISIVNSLAKASELENMEKVFQTSTLRMSNTTRSECDARNVIGFSRRATFDRQQPTVNSSCMKAYPCRMQTSSHYLFNNSNSQIYHSNIRDLDQPSNPNQQYNIFTRNLSKTSNKNPNHNSMTTCGELQILAPVSCTMVPIMVNNHTSRSSDSLLLPISSNSVSEILSNSAYAEYQNGNFVHAEKYCHSWLLHDPDSISCLLLLSSINFRLKHFDKSAQYSLLAMKRNPRIAESYFNLGNVLEEQGNFHQAIEHYRVAVLLKPSLTDAHISMAFCLTAIGDVEGAIKSYIHALHYRPDLYFVRSDLGNLLKVVGRLEDAKICYQRAIETKNDFAVAWNNLGCIHSMLGEVWLSLHHFDKAITYDPNFFEAYINYGNILKEVRLYERACILYHKALSLNLAHPLIIANLASVYSLLGHIDMAIEMYHQAIQAQPNFPDAYCNLANVFKSKGMVDQAEEYYKKAISLCSTHADSYNNLAYLMWERCNVSEAERLYKKAIECSSSFAAAHSNLAGILQTQGRIVEALTHYREALRLNPNMATTHSNYGNALKEMQDYRGAIESYNRAIQLDPTLADAHSNLACAYKDLGNFSEAISYFRIALRLRSNYPDAFGNLVHCYQMTCNWLEYDERMKQLVSLVDLQLKNSSQSPSSATFLPCVHPHHSMLYPLSPEQRKGIASAHAILCFSRINNNISNDFNEIPHTSRFATCENGKIVDTNQKSIECRIHVGYVSSDFCNHPTSHLMQSIPGMHDRKKFKIHLFALSPNDNSSFRKKLQNESEVFVDLSQFESVVKMSEKIRSHGIDILFNLNGYTKGAKNEIFALRSAPIQVMWLGYPGTSGATYMDYLITDVITSPSRFAHHYSERLMYIKDSFFIGDHRHIFPHILQDLTHDKRIYRILSGKSPSSASSVDSFSYHDPPSFQNHIDATIPKRILELDGCKDCGESIPNENQFSNYIMTRSRYNLPETSFVYCCFNQLYKVDPKTFSSWCNILNSVPNSVLWLLKFPSSGEINLRNELKAHGIPSDRLIFSDVAPKEEHVRRGQLADVCLDTPICNGHTTGMDALWSGCPIVTFPLESLASRIGASIVTAIGCSELVASSFEEYENIAIRLACDREFFIDIRRRVWEGRMESSLFDVQNYTLRLEEAIQTMCDSHRRETET